MQGNMETANHVLQAGAWISVPANGDKVFVMEATAPVDVEFIGTTGERIGYANGMDVGDGGGPGPWFRSLRIKSASAQTVKLAVTGGEFVVSRIAGQVAVVPPADLSTNADQTLTADTATVIAAADTTRREIMIRAPKTNTVNIRIGDSNVGSARGIEVEPGQTMVLNTAAAVYGYPDGDDADVQVLTGAN